MIIDSPVIISAIELAFVMNLAMQKCVHAVGQMVFGRKRFATTNISWKKDAARIIWAQAFHHMQKHSMHLTLGGKFMRHMIRNYVDSSQLSIMSLIKSPSSHKTSKETEFFNLSINNFVNKINTDYSNQLCYVCVMTIP